MKKNKKKSGDNIADRLLEFAVRVIKLVNALPKTAVGKHVGAQLLSSGTSPGSNYEEACGAESRADFIHKLGIVLKELKESRFWLRLIHRTEILNPQRVEPMIDECEELISIIAKSIVTAKSKK
ncbi:MAG: four helix bundle protein [Candidatus Marinimicrobia bacterium]|nr:four helix bundle protein [Candidatus Neomarinimicrobiota bacterium]